MSCLYNGSVNYEQANTESAWYVHPVGGGNSGVHMQPSLPAGSNATNHIRSICDGSALALFVNGRRLATAEDSTFAKGDIALTATSYEDEPTEVHFDSLVVQRP
jgi:hypothetical protein